MVGTVVEVTRSAVETQMRATLSDLGLPDYASFEARERSGRLSDAEWERADELRGMAFLLGPAE